MSAVPLLACGGGSDAGQLKVTQVFTPAKPIAIEGSAAQLAVKQDGKLIERVRTDISQVGEPEVLFDGALTGGSYDLEVAHRACYGPGSCFIPEEKSFLRCAGEVAIRDGETSEITVHVSGGFSEGGPTCKIAES